MNFALGFDIGAALFLTAMGTRGFFRGLLGEALSLVGLIGGIFFAWKFAHPVMEMLLGTFPNLDPSVANIIAMSVIFFAVAVSVAIISKIMLAVVKFAQLSTINHILGLVLGVLVGVAILLFIYGAITLFAPALGDGWLDKSIFMGMLAKIWPTFKEFMIHYGWIDAAKFTPYLPQIP